MPERTFAFDSYLYVSYRINKTLSVRAVRTAVQYHFMQRHLPICIRAPSETRKLAGVNATCYILKDAAK